MCILLNGSFVHSRPYNLMHRTYVYHKTTTIIHTSLRSLTHLLSLTRRRWPTIGSCRRWISSNIRFDCAKQYVFVSGKNKFIGVLKSNDVNSLIHDLRRWGSVSISEQMRLILASSSPSTTSIGIEVVLRSAAPPSCPSLSLSGLFRSTTKLRAV